VSFGLRFGLDQRVQRRRNRKDDKAPTTKPSKEKKIILPRKLLLLLTNFVWLNVIDLITTWIMLDLGGKEINPFFLFLNTTGVTLPVIAIKIGGTFSLVVSLLIYFFSFKELQWKRTQWKRPKRRERVILLSFVYTVAVITNIVYFYVLFNNIYMLNTQIQYNRSLLKPLI
jgi:hypothetical protein